MSSVLSAPAVRSSDAAQRVDVAVVGAGVVGLASALGLAQAGLKVALIGPPARRHAPREDAPFDVRIYALSAGSLRLLERLQVWQAIDAARVQPVERMRILGDRGAALNFDAYGAAVERLATIVEESELLRVLLAAVSFAPGIRRLDGNLQTMNASGQGALLTVGAPGGPSVQLAAQLVVGADGAASAVRAAAGIHARETSYGQTAVVGNFIAHAPHHGTAWQWFTQDGVVALLPLPQQHVSLVWSAPEVLARELLALTPADRAARVRERVQGVLGDLVPHGDAGSFPLRCLRVSPRVGQRVALVGDAAHVVHPLAGQGLNLGLQDVAALLDVIGGREAWRDVGDPVLLRRYARQRAEPVEAMTIVTDGLVRLFSREDALTAQLRNTGLALVERLAPIKRRLIRQAMQ